MTKEEVIESTMHRMRSAGGLLANDAPGTPNSYEDMVIATLQERLPDCDVRVCEDFQHLGIECCDVCHSFYAHYDMHLEQQADGQIAWICCTVRGRLTQKKLAHPGPSQLDR